MALSLLMFVLDSHLRASFNFLRLCSVGIISRDTKTKLIIYINTQVFLNVTIITDGVIAAF